MFLFDKEASQLIGTPRPEQRLMAYDESIDSLGRLAVRVLDELERPANERIELSPAIIANIAAYTQTVQNERAAYIDSLNPAENSSTGVLSPAIYTQRNI